MNERMGHRWDLLTTLFGTNTLQINVFLLYLKNNLKMEILKYKQRIHNASTLKISEELRLVRNLSTFSCYI